MLCSSLKEGIIISTVRSLYEEFGAIEKSDEMLLASKTFIKEFKIGGIDPISLIKIVYISQIYGGNYVLAGNHCLVSNDKIFDGLSKNDRRFLSLAIKSMGKTTPPRNSMELVLRAVA